MTDGMLNPYTLWIVHAHANVSGNCVCYTDAEIQKLPKLMRTSVLLIGTQMLRQKILSFCFIFSKTVGSCSKSLTTNFDLSENGKFGKLNTPVRQQCIW